MTDNLTIEKATEILEKYKHLLKKNEYNFFNIINLSENSDSEFLAWLFDVKNKEDIRYTFVKNFLKKINVEDNKIDEIIENLKVKTEYNIGDDGKIDIFLYTERDGKYDFLCVIENKLDAKFSNKTKNKLDQLCKYYTHFIEKKETTINITENAIKKFVLTFIDGRVKGRIYSKYIPIDHSDILICLAKTIDNKNNNEISFFDNNICDDDDKLTGILSLLYKGNYKLSEKNKEIIKNTIDQEKLQDKKFNRKNKIKLKKFFQCQSPENCKFLVEQYIYYFEHLNNFNSGYTHLVKYDKEYYFIYDVDKIIQNANCANCKI